MYLFYVAAGAPSSSSSTPDTVDSSKNINKKDYTHIKSVLDSAMFYYGARGGEVKEKKKRDVRPAFGRKTDFCCI